MYKIVSNYEIDFLAMSRVLAISAKTNHVELVHENELALLAMDGVGLHLYHVIQLFCGA